MTFDEWWKSDERTHTAMKYQDPFVVGTVKSIARRAYENGYQSGEVDAKSGTASSADRRTPETALTIAEQ